MNGIVYIVHCVDTEGPLHEDIKATFARIKEAFQADIEPLPQNLERLQNMQIPLGGKEKAIIDFIRSDQLSYNDTWEKIQAMHDILFSEKFRARYPDSFGQRYRFSWFCMDHVNFRNNPRRRTLGFHAIFQEYQRILEKHVGMRDRIYWHYHPRSFSNDAHRSGTNYSFSNVHNEILARRIIDHLWFPVANRATSAEHIDSSLWLEQWIPFDFANSNMEKNAGLETQEACGRVPGRFADWRGSITEWTAYHPSVWDSRKHGNLRRYIARCLNMNCRHSMITAYEVEKAFSSARAGRSCLLSVTNHDFRNMVEETTDFIDMVRSVSKKYPDVKFRWSNAVEAFRGALDMPRISLPKIKCEIKGNLLRVTSDRSIWGPQPFLAISMKNGNYYHDNFIINSEMDWTYVFDHDSVLLDDVSKVGIATNDSVGNTIVSVCDLQRPDEWKARALNIDDWHEVTK